MRTKSHCIALIVLVAVILAGCTTRQNAPVYTRDGKVYGRASGTIFRHNWWNYFERGVSYAEGRYFDDAVADLEAALALRYRDQRMARTYGMHFIDYFPHRELGIVFFETGNLEAARIHLERSLSHYPSAKARYYLDQVRREQIRQSGKFVSPPSIALADDAPVRWTRRDPVMVKGQVVDTHFVASVRIDDSPVFMDGARQQVQFRVPLQLDHGAHSVAVTAENLADRRAVRRISVNVDRQGPMIGLTNVKPVEESPHSAIVIEGVITDWAGIASARIDATPIPRAEGNQVRFSVSVPRTGKALNLAAADVLGNQTSASFLPQFHVRAQRSERVLAANSSPLLTGLFGPADQSAPTIVIKDWDADTVVYVDTVLIDGYVRDSGAVRSLSINGKAVDAVQGNLVFFNHVMPLQTGKNTIVVEAVDDNGNRSRKTIAIQRRVPAAFHLDARLKVSVFPFKRVNLQTSDMVFQEYLIDALIGQQRFRVVERDLLESILQEQRLSRTAIIDRRTALELGRLAAAQSIIAGSMVRTRHGIEIVSRMIDTETSEILSAEDVFGAGAVASDASQYAELAQGMALKYHRAFPLAGGTVVNASGDTFFTDMGHDKIKRQRRVIVYRESPVRHPVSQRVLGVDQQILCRARVTQVQDQMSKARVQGTPVAAVEPLQKVVAE